MILRKRFSKLVISISVGVSAVAMIGCEELAGTATPSDGTTATETPSTSSVSRPDTSSATPSPGAGDDVTPTSGALINPIVSPIADTQRPTPTVSGTRATPVTPGGGRGGNIPPVGTVIPVRPTSVTGGGGPILGRPTATPSTGGGVITPGTGGSTELRIDTSDLSLFEGAELISFDGTVLAVLLPARDAFNSVCNSAGESGSPFGANSIFNDMSELGGPFGSSSPFNPDATTPPQIVVNGEIVAHLSVSPHVPNAVDPYAMLEWLGCPTTPG